jgi:outer membrane receptor for ferrienterochelin and colicins
VFDSSVNRRVRVVDYSLYEVNNYSKTLGHDVSYQPNEQWNFQAGLQREKRDLQKAAKVVFGPSLQPEEFELADYIFPQLPSNDPTPDNRIKVINDSLYLLSKYQTQGWWSWLEQQSLHLGIRVDKHSEQGSIITKRGGLVGQKNQWTFKLLYGESFQEPPPRVLYGGWTGSGSDPEVKPETASTLEFSIGQQNESSSFLFSVYAIETQDTIAAIAGGATNTNSRKVLGEDIHYKVLMPVDSLNEWYLWGYFSHLDAKEKQSNKELNIGDSSPYKLWLGSNITINDYWRSSIRARYFSNKKTIASNPVDKVPAYWTADLTVDYLIPSSHNLTLSFSINNLFDKHYTHAGVRTADAGQNAGYFDEDGVFQGASGFFSSLLPQEGRTVQISLLFSL